MHDPEKRNKAIARQIKKGKNAKPTDVNIAPVFNQEPETQNLVNA